MLVKSLESRVNSQKLLFAVRTCSGSRLSTLDCQLATRGMTLIELLAVIVILTTLVAAAIPLLSPSNDDRRLREAARGLNTYITGAQNRAISTHRPFGVALKRLSQDTNTNKAANNDVHPDNGVCLEAYYVEQQPPYCGFDPNSRACVAIHPNQVKWPGYALVRLASRKPGNPPSWSADLFPQGTIRPGDVILINGTRFKLVAVYTSADGATVSADSNGYYVPPNTDPAQLLARPTNDSGQQINPRYDNDGNEIGSITPSPPPYWTSPAPYKILRQPAPTSDEPYQLPEGTAIDLRASGVGDQNYFYNPEPSNPAQRVDNSDGILIIFAPEGRVARISFSQTPPNGDPRFDQAVVDNVHLLIGRRENIPAPNAGTESTLNSSQVGAATTDDERAKLRQPINWLGGSSRWVVIGSQSGRIATIENAFVDLAAVLANPQAPFTSAAQSTEEMRSAQILAAREFAREMEGVGGR